MISMIIMHFSYQKWRFLEFPRFLFIDDKSDDDDDDDDDDVTPKTDQTHDL